MKEVINWMDYGLFTPKNDNTYLLEYIALNTKKRVVGLFYYQDGEWYDEDYTTNYEYLSQPGVITMIAEIPKCKNNLDLQQLEEKIILLENTIISLGKVIKEKKEMWDYFEKRFVKISTCTPDKKEKCIVYPDRCEGERCMEWLDLVDLLDKATDKGEIK